MAYYHLLRGVMKVMRTMRSWRPPDYFAVVPAPTSQEGAAELYANLTWYVPSLHRVAPVVLDSEVGVSPRDAPWMDPALVQRPPWLRSSPPPAGRPHLIIHEVSLGVLLAALPRLGRATIIDPNLFYGSDFRGYLRLRKMSNDSSVIRRNADEAVAALFELSGARSCLVLGTGPSATSVTEHDADVDLRIACNSAVRNQQLLELIRPQVIAFGDPVFHFGPSRYAATFRDDMLRAVDKWNSLVVVPSWQLDILLENCPALAGRVVPVDMTPECQWRWVSRDDVRVRPTGNVLTEMMLPTAFALAQEVKIAGCDGRKPSESYFWRHNPATQYDDELMMSVFAAHPAFFRDRDYKDYYARHCADLEAFLQVAEAAGKCIRSITTSYIPALRSRSERAT